MLRGLPEFGSLVDYRAALSETIRHEEDHLGHLPVSERPGIAQEERLREDAMGYSQKVRQGKDAYPV